MGDITLSNYIMSTSYAVITSITSDELESWKGVYMTNQHRSKVLYVVQSSEPGEFPQYQYHSNRLLYFKDWNRNLRLCIPSELQLNLICEVHDSVSEAVHSSYAKTYNQIASVYYWPKMSRDIKKCTESCDICQKSKPHHHAPIGLLQLIPIPSQPFEVVSMDFIPELPTSEGYNNILVIVDKLTKYAIFMPTTVTVNKEDMARLFFKHVISQFGIPQQVITDRDTRWRGTFWDAICKQMGMKKSLTTSYHPQADGQTEVLNQGLEISLHAYIA